MSKRTGLEGPLAGLARGCGFRFLVMLYVFGVVGVCMACSLLLVPVLGIDPSIVIMLGLFGGVILAVMGAIAGIFVYRLRRDSDLDEAFTAVGLEGRAYQVGGRQFHGTIQGRTVEVYLARGPMLDIYVHAPLNTDVAIGTRSSLGATLNKLINREPMQLHGPTYKDMLVFGIDENWTRGLLDTPAGQKTISHLMHSHTTELRQIQITAHTTLFRIHRINPTNITTPAVQTWLAALFHLVNTAQQLPQPTITAQPSQLAKKVRQSPLNSPAVLIGISVAIVAIVLISTILLTFLMLALNN